MSEKDISLTLKFTSFIKVETYSKTIKCVKSLEKNYKPIDTSFISLDFMEQFETNKHIYTIKAIFLSVGFAKVG